VRQARAHGTHGTDETDGTGRHASRVMGQVSALVGRGYVDGSTAASVPIGIDL